jgi:hypothetical protein
MVYKPQPTTQQTPCIYHLKAVVPGNRRSTLASAGSRKGVCNLTPSHGSDPQHLYQRYPSTNLTPSQGSDPLLISGEGGEAVSQARRGPGDKGESVRSSLAIHLYMFGRCQR